MCVCERERKRIYYTFSNSQAVVIILPYIDQKETQPFGVQFDEWCFDILNFDHVYVGALFFPLFWRGNQFTAFYCCRLNLFVHNILNWCTYRPSLIISWLAENVTPEFHITCPIFPLYILKCIRWWWFLLCLCMLNK